MGLSVFQPTVPPPPPPHHNHVTDQTVLLSLFPLLFFLSALQSNNNRNKVYVCGHNCVLGPYQSHFNPCLAAGAKFTLWHKLLFYYILSSNTHI